MKRITVIFFLLTSCASHKYVPASGPVKPPIENKNRKAIVSAHIAMLIMTGFIFHALNEDSN